MKKQIGTFDMRKNTKNTVCKIPVLARYSLKEGKVESIDRTFCDIPLDQFGQYLAGKLGIDIE